MAAMPEDGTSVSKEHLTNAAVIAMDLVNRFSVGRKNRTLRARPASVRVSNTTLKVSRAALATRDTNEASTRLEPVLQAQLIRSSKLLRSCATQNPS